MPHKIKKKIVESIFEILLSSEVIKAQKQKQLQVVHKHGNMGKSILVRLQLDSKWKLRLTIPICFLVSSRITFFDRWLYKTSSNSILSKSYLNCTKYYAFKFEVVLTRPQFDLIAQLDRSRIINRYGYLGYPKNFVEAKL